MGELRGTVVGIVNKCRDEEVVEKLEERIVGRTALHDIYDPSNSDLIVNSGDKIAVDGVVIEGTASIDESMITGESLGVIKEAGQEVIGGTILTSGNIKIRATKVGADTLLSNIIELVKDSCYLDLKLFPIILLYSFHLFL